MVEYTLVYAVTAEELVFTVQSSLGYGWECQGGVCHSDAHGWFYQAMIRKKKPKKAATSRFKKPTQGEVFLYCVKRKNGINATDFVDYYDSCGWKVGNKPMKDWKACIRTWEKRDRDKSPKKTTAIHPDEQEIFG